MNRTDLTGIVMWAMAGLCVVLAIVVAPQHGGSTVIPLLIAVAIGYMAHRRRQRLDPRRATDA